ncbi:MAG: DUF4041 domain-containing protein [Bacteroidetes bacterium]|nr:DUF4041 domain-containing protein [Bacteroidota bacterium]
MSESINSFEEKVKDLKLQLEGQKSTFDATSEDISKMRKEIELFQDTLELGTYGVYQPQFNFEVSSQYSEKLELNYQKQRLLIKQGAGAKCDRQWVVRGSQSEGKKMTKQYEKLMIFAFNGECEAIISKVKWNNIEKSKERIVKIYENVNTLGSSHEIYVTKSFLECKLEELALTYEYELKKYEEKEEQKRLKEQMKEEERALRELERAKKSAEQDEIVFEKEIEKTKQQLESGLIDNKNELLEKIAQLEAELQLAHERKDRAISMAQQTKVGHIYVVSNIGAFGENVYKIGMTRRLDPKERVKELGDASVPFHFDVHAIIYSENAPQLEYEIHKQFDNQRLNKINYRKEFFKITLDELEKIHSHNNKC